MLPANIGLRLSAAATGVQTWQQARPGRDDVAMQAQLPAVHHGLRPSDTGEIAGRFWLRQVARLQQHRIDMHVKARLRLQAPDHRVVGPTVRRRSRLSRHVRRDDLWLLSSWLPTLHHISDVRPGPVSVRRRGRLPGRSRRTQLSWVPI